MEGMHKLIEEKGIWKTLAVLKSGQTSSTLYGYHTNSYLPAPLWKFSGEYGENHEMVDFLNDALDCERAKKQRT